MAALPKQRVTRFLSLALALATLLVTLPFDDAANPESKENDNIKFNTYDNNPRDLSEPATHHVKTKQKTRVSMDDLKLGDLEAKEAAQQVMNRITMKVSFLSV